MSDEKLRWFLQRTIRRRSHCARTTLNHFAHNLRHFRLKSHMSKQALARRLHVDTSTIYNYETGRRCPNFDILIQLSDILQVSLDDLLR